MLSVLILGFLIGLQHALEADHVAAVSSLAARETTTTRIVRHGMLWGVGHTVTLMAFAGAALVLNISLGAETAKWLEIAVGVMLVLLGGHVLYQLYLDRIHFHTHRHADGIAHFHAHSHAGDQLEHRPQQHDHEHPAGLPIRTLLVGMMHGMAGSAALLVLSTTTVESPFLGMVYIALFGAGSILGMAILSAVIAVPLLYSARFLTWSNRILQSGVGVGTMALGMVVIVSNAGMP